MSKSVGDRTSVYQSLIRKPLLTSMSFGSSFVFLYKLKLFTGPSESNCWMTFIHSLNFSNQVSPWRPVHQIQGVLHPCFLNWEGNPKVTKA